MPPLTVTTVGGDSEINPGDTLRLRGATWSDYSGDVWVIPVAPDASTRPSRPSKSGEAKRIGPMSGGLTWTAGGTGQYRVTTGPTPRLGLADYRRDDMDGTDEALAGYTVVDGEAANVNPDDYINVHDDTAIDPSNYRGIVNADNEQGIALAPSLRREGASLGPDGATVTLPDGETVDVGAVSDADEVARVLDGDDAGDVIDADRPALGDSSGGGSGMIGGAVAVVLALLVGAAALLGGGE